MNFDDISSEKIIETIKKLINVSQKNYRFINLLKEIYYRERDIKILLLMYNKKICLDDTFLYKELINQTNSKNIKIFLIQKAILKCCTEQKSESDIIKELTGGLIENSIRELKSFKIDLNEVTRFLKPSSLFLWGKEWLMKGKVMSFDLRNFLDADDIYKSEFISFEFKAYFDKNKKYENCKNIKDSYEECEFEINDINDYKLFKGEISVAKNMEKYNCFINRIINEFIKK
ncbi:hypothetical protein DMUE_0559 [Dictyocoela muelleri]|nr:hypothetical protein DMUE_0559 [Dictyocoela muelleri]